MSSLQPRVLAIPVYLGLETRPGFRGDDFKYANRVTWLEADIAIDMDSLRLIRRLLETFGGPFCPRLCSLDVTRFPWASLPGNHYSPLFNLLLGSKPKKVGLPEFVVDRAIMPSLVSDLHKHTPLLYKLAVTSINSPINYSGSVELPGAPRTASQGLCRSALAGSPFTNNPAISLPSLQELYVELHLGLFEDLVLKSQMPALRTVQFR
ncbi:hypothetical protein FRB95_004880 [Tulasnella sp. JGI-2019a]|nr:hypothetical protein FRB95_004880 [Tulasnella sp. JGI-2019a]